MLLSILYYTLNHLIMPMINAFIAQEIMPVRKKKQPCPRQADRAASLVVNRCFSSAYGIFRSR